MCEIISSPLFNRSLEEIMMIRNIGDQSNLSNIFGEISDNSLLHDSPTSFFHQDQGLGHDDFFNGFSPATASGGEDKTAKKMNHNASERDRRKKINDLYSSLRSLLPHADQMKKLSIPGTVGRVLKYVPELRKELELLQQKKQSLLKEKMAQQEKSCQLEKQKGKDNYTLSSSSVISAATRLSDREIMIQISTIKANKGSFSQVLSYLEQNGFVLQDSSSFESFEERVFYNLHLQVEGTRISMDLEDLKEKLSKVLFENQEEPLMRLNFGSNDLVEPFF